jgi:hypothetical protein
MKAQTDATMPGGSPRPVSSRRPAAIGAAGAIAGVLLLLYIGRGERPAPPANLHVGERPPEALAAVIGADQSDAITSVDVVFVAERCLACRTLVGSLARTGRRPPGTRRVVFVTDRAWPELQRLASDRVQVLADTGRLGQTIGLRATPTLVALNVATDRIDRIGIGVMAAADRFTITETFK